MTTKVLKSTERGQITLPKKWRSRFQTDTYFVQMHDDRIVIAPFHVQNATDEEIIFDADRDNDGKGISPDDMIRLLKKIRHG
ncbi:AbrB/MazE/SpoVT family DNA-binding domain-containing protein [Candidatus Peregrinibacteria bacterium]|nr:AbrB/MazE/SpoVT family DNA-binding domain-containing protein [Candidatus Peregrinibacteria bacterium]